MEQVRDQTFKSQIVDLDGKHFQNCHLLDCELQYSGGEFVLEETSITNCKWTFGGAAQRTLRLVNTLQLAIGDQFKDSEAELWPVSLQIQ